MNNYKEPGKVLRKVKGVWQVVAYFCKKCNRQLSTEFMITKHINSCKHINTLNKEDTFMPIHRVMKNGVPYYKWGDSGKLYRKREDAEQQARAAYASGYKEKKEIKNK